MKWVFFELFIPLLACCDSSETTHVSQAKLDNPPPNPRSNADSDPLYSTPHTHPRASEFFTIALGGNVKTGFIQENGGMTAITTILNEYEVDKWLNSLD
jgi:hypothetical protein